MMNSYKKIKFYSRLIIINKIQMKVNIRETSPIMDQKCGTSGLRKKTKLVMNTPNYLENFC